jgi:glycine cleavage system transcriptional repressor
MSDPVYVPAYPRRVRHYALSAIGRDKPGIVAEVTGVLLGHTANVEDSQMTILRGHFAMTLIVAVPADADPDRLRVELEEAGERLGLEAIALREVEELDPEAPEPSHMVTLYGVDHPGIVHAAARALADRGVDITDLNTRLVEEEGEEPLYALLMEVALPGGISPEELEGALREVGARQGVEVSLRELARDAL